MRKYKIGDKVTIRSWESMEKEFGADGSDDLKCGFVSAMRHICGISTTISEVHKSGVYNVLNGEFFAFTPQMFTNWETDNANEMKMQYNGQDVELITEGYWPEGVKLICSDDCDAWNAPSCKAICLHNSMAFYIDGHVGRYFEHWAVLPKKPAPRRLTNREVAGLCRKGWDILDGEWVYTHASYKKEYENDPTPKGVTLRAPNSDEWLDPTSDLLEVGK